MLGVAINDRKRFIRGKEKHLRCCTARTASPWPQQLDRSIIHPTRHLRLDILHMHMLDRHILKLHRLRSRVAARVRRDLNPRTALVVRGVLPTKTRITRTADHHSRRILLQSLVSHRSCGIALAPMATATRNQPTLPPSRRRRRRRRIMVDILILLLHRTRRDDTRLCPRIRSILRGHCRFAKIENPPPRFNLARRPVQRTDAAG